MLPETAKERRKPDLIHPSEILWLNSCRLRIKGIRTCAFRPVMRLNWLLAQLETLYFLMDFLLSEHEISLINGYCECNFIQSDARLGYCELCVIKTHLLYLVLLNKLY